MSPITEPKRLLSRAEACAFLGIHITTLYHLERQGKLPAVRIGKRVLFRIEDLEEFIEGLRQGSRRGN